GDMPWVLTETRAPSALRREVEPYISPAGQSLQRLYALGIDTFNIIAALNPLRRYPYERYDGETGSLSLDTRNRVHRTLTWVRFRSGRPALLDAANQ
ncbi:MAG: penicillin-binding protein activator, partial [Pseudomonadota bacterium]